jgi:TolB-like protein
MSDIFISYARSTDAEAQLIAAALVRLGYRVWRDDQLPAHRDYSEVIEERLRAAQAVLVVWSAEAVKSQWVLAEADVARLAGTLVQLSLDGSIPPLPFNRIQCADLRGWAGEAEAPGWRKVLDSIGALVGGEVAAARPEATAVGPPSSAKPSIAVLPFDNLSKDPEQEYFADAITEDIISALSRWRWFFVISRNSSFIYKGRAVDVRRVGAELAVRYVLEGSVRKVANRVRINAQLIDAATGAHVWAERFDRDLIDLLELQDEITAAAVRAIEPAMLHNENFKIARKAPKDYSALDCFQRGMWHLNKVARDSYEPSLALFREAIARDPELALGHIGLSRVLYGGAVAYGWSDRPDEDLKQSYASARTAIGLDPDAADAYFAASGAALFLGLHHDALAMAQKSIALNPNFAYGQFRLAQVLIYAGRPQEAIGLIEQSLKLSPFDPQTGGMLGGLALAHYQAGDYAEAEVQARRAIEHDFRGGSVLLAAALARQGRLSEARAALPAKLLELAARESARLATYALARDRDHLLGGLVLAGVGPMPPAPEHRP